MALVHVIFDPQTCICSYYLHMMPVTQLPLANLRFVVCLSLINMDVTEQSRGNQCGFIGIIREIYDLAVNKLAGS